MTYIVTVDAGLPEGVPELGPLQRVGAVALLEDGFGSVDTARAPADLRVDLVDSVVAVHPRGALLKVVVDAPALEAAERAVRFLVEGLLERSELLADWPIERCEVVLHSKAALESLEAAGGPDAPPADPAARKARHSEPPRGTGAGIGHDADAEAQGARRQMLGLADALRSFPPATFGVRAEDDARLAAGALVWATGVLVDHLFEDVQTLSEEDTTVAECDSPLWHLEALPARYALQYDSLFARRFLVTVIALTTRFTDGTFRRLSCVAEELALKLLLDEARVTLETFGLLGDGVSIALETFADTVHEDMDHTWLYDASLDGIDESPVGNALGVRPLRFKEWFTPLDKGRHVHPYATDDQPDP
ncbi:hypothetical protein ACH4UY_33720 [Streptomyces longwoodensis]|uniref:hypothetical protein n=1 Tax=Streptomyces longwoodensis TaxID=68231 RepID=UPI00378D1E2C